MGIFFNMQHVFLSFNFTAQLCMAYIIIAAIPFVTVLFRIIQHSIFHHLLSLLFLSSVSSSTSFYISYVISNPYMLHHFIIIHTFFNFSTSLHRHRYELSLFIAQNYISIICCHDLMTKSLLDKHDTLFPRSKKWRVRAKPNI